MVGMPLPVAVPSPRFESRLPCISSPASTSRTFAAPTAVRTSLTTWPRAPCPGLLPDEASSWPWKSFVCRIVNVTGTGGARARAGAAPSDASSATTVSSDEWAGNVSPGAPPTRGHARGRGRPAPSQRAARGSDAATVARPLGEPATAERPDSARRGARTSTRRVAAVRPRTGALRCTAADERPVKRGSATTSRVAIGRIPPLPCRPPWRSGWRASPRTSGPPPPRRPGPVLCIAPAGSGKTTTLVARVAWLVATGVDPATIAAITFNARAAEELRERLAPALEPLGPVATPAPAGPRRRRASGPDVPRARPRDPPRRRAGRRRWWPRDRVLRAASCRGRMPPTRRRLDDAFSRLKLDLGVTAGRRAARPGARTRRPRLPRLRAGARATPARATSTTSSAGRSGPSRPTRRSSPAGGRAARTCSSTRSRTSTRASSGWRCSWPRRRTASSSSATTTRASTAGGWPTCGGSSGLAAALPGLRRVDLAVNYRCPAPVLARAVRLVEHNRERFAKEIRPGPGGGGATRSWPRRRPDPAVVDALLRRWPADGTSRRHPGPHAAGAPAGGGRPALRPTCRSAPTASRSRSTTRGSTTWSRGRPRIGGAWRWAARLATVADDPMAADDGTSRAHDAGDRARPRARRPADADAPTRSPRGPSTSCGRRSSAGPSACRATPTSGRRSPTPGPAWRACGAPTRR